MLIRESHMVEGTGEEGKKTGRWIDGDKKVCLHLWKTSSIVEICLQMDPPHWCHIICFLFCQSFSFV